MPPCRLPRSTCQGGASACGSVAAARCLVRSEWLPTVLAVVFVAASSVMLDAPVVINGLSRIRAAALLLDGLLADLQGLCGQAGGTTARRWLRLLSLRVAGLGGLA